MQKMLLIRKMSKRSKRKFFQQICKILHKQIDFLPSFVIIKAEILTDW